MSLTQLTANYTDSEGEDEEDDTDTSNKVLLGTGTGMLTAGIISDEVVMSDTNLPLPVPAVATTSYNKEVEPPKDTSKDTPVSAESRGSTAANTPQKKALNRLVSYANEEEDDDDMDSRKDDLEDQDEILQSEAMDTGTEDGEDDTTRDDREQALKLIPTAPMGKCSQHLQDKINNYMLKVQMSNFDSNAIIQNNKAYRNPSIYEKLVEHLGLDEMGSNYPLEMFDAHCWSDESYYDELAKIQKAEMDRREKERKEKLKVEVVTGMKKPTPALEEESKKQRKSRFDQCSSIPHHLKNNPPPAPLLSVPSGTKPTISAFGALAKQ